MNQLSKNKLWFIGLVDKLSKEVGYGAISFSVVLKDTEPQQETLQITKSKRKKYGKHTQSGRM